MTTDRDDRLIQKCVDNEVTAEERRELMQRLDNVIDGWKVLACSFMEDQLFAQANCDAASSKSVVNASADARAHRRHWFYHPLTSLVLSACVAFMAGVLIAGEMQKASQISVADAESDSTGVVADSSVADRTVGTPSTAAAELVSDGGGYQVRIEQDGMPARVLPVFNQEDYVSGVRKFWQQMRETRGSNIYDVRDPEIHFFEFTGNDGKRYVIPVEGIPATPRYQ